MKKYILILIILSCLLSCMRFHTTTDIDKSIDIKPSFTKEVNLIKDTVHINGKNIDSFKFIIPHHLNDEIEYISGSCTYKKNIDDDYINKKLELAEVAMTNRSGGPCKTAIAVTTKKVSELNTQSIEPGYYNFEITYKIGELKYTLISSTHLKYNTKFEYGIPILRWKM